MKNEIIVTVMAAVIGIGSYAIGTTQAKTIIETQIVTKIETVTEIQTITEIQEVEKEKIIEVIPDNYINTTSYDFYNNYIDMRQVVDFSTSENGLYLYTQDGNGYYWEK